jgi:hypothetical protein
VLYYTAPYLLLPVNSADETYWQAAFVWNVIWMVVALLIVRRAGRLLGGEKVGKIAALLFLLMPFGVYYSYGISAETPAYVAAAIFTYGWALWMAKNTRHFAWAETLAIVAGLAGLILCRPNALVVVGIAAACAGGAWVVKDGERKRAAGFATLCIVVSVATLLFVSVTLKRVAGNRGTELQSANLSDVLFFGSFQFRNEPWDWRFWGKATRQGSVDYQDWQKERLELLDQEKQSGVPMSQLERQWTVRDVEHHPVKRLEMFAVRALNLNVWIVNSREPADFRLGPLHGRAFYYAFHVLINMITLVPLIAAVYFLAVNPRQIFATWPLWGVWVGLLLFHAFTYAEPRYMLPGQPGLEVLAACALGRLNRIPAISAEAHP